jgi:import inner membrane translocase subunit TIM54
MNALKKGWLEPVDVEREARGRADDEEEDERLARQLQEEDDRSGGGPFSEDVGEDGGEDASSKGGVDDAVSGAPGTLGGPQAFSPWRMQLPPQTPSPAPPASHTPSAPVVLAAPDRLPTQPPLLFVPFDHPLSRMRWWPIKIYRSLFGERERVREGGELALDLTEAVTRPYEPPQSLREGLFTEEDETRPLLDEEGKKREDVELEGRSVGGDSDFDLSAEAHYHKARVYLALV